MRRLKPIALYAALCSLSMFGCTPKEEAPKADEAKAAAVDKQDAAEASPRAPSEFPADTIGLVSIKQPKQVFDALQALVTSVDPAAGHALGMTLTELPGVDLTQPVHVLVLDPQQFDPPVAVIAKVTDTKALAPMLTSLNIGTEQIGDMTLLGADAVRGQVRQWVTEKLPSRPTPEHLTFYLNRTMVAAKYQTFKPLILMGLGSAGPSAQKMLTPMMEALESFGAQVEDVRLAVELSPTRADMVFSSAAKPESTFAKVIADQQDVKHALGILSQVQGAERAAFLAGGSYRINRSKPALVEMAAGMMANVGTMPLPEATRFMQLWADLLGGSEMVMIGEMQGYTFQGAYAFRIKDEAAAQTFIDEAIAPIYTRSWQIAGMMTFEGKGCEKRTESGLDLLVCKGLTTLDPALKVPAGTVPPEMSIAVAREGNMLYMSLNDTQGLFELRKKFSEPSAKPAVIAGVEYAKTRSESFYMRYDLVAFVGAALAQAGGKLPKGPQSFIDYSLGAKGGRMSLRIGAAASDIKAMVATLGALKSSGM